MPATSRRWWTLFAMSGALTMVMVDGTGVSVALPHIQRSLGLDQGALQWVITAFSLTLAATLATGGRLGDLLGRVRVLVTGVLLFAIGSIVCSVAPNLIVLLTGRVLEGFGNVLMIPAAAVLVTEAFDPKDRGKAMGLYTILGSVFMVLGPIIGGLLVEFVSWRAVFLVNIPIAAVVLILVRIARPEDHPPIPQPLRISHTFLLMAALTALVLGLQQSHRWHWTSPWTIGLLVGGIALLAVFVWTQLKAAEPLLDVRLFTDRGYVGDAVVLYTAQFALIGQVAFNAIYLQNILGFTPFHSGLALLLLLLPWMLMAPVAGWLFDRFGLKLPAVIGMACVTLGFFLEAQTFPYRHFAYVAPCMLLIGAGLGLALPQTYTDGMSRVSPNRRGQAFGVLDTLRQVGSAMGMAIIGTVVAAQELPKLAPMAEKFATAPEEKAELQTTLLEAVRGQDGAGAKLRERWPAALNELKESGARSIADGYLVGSSVTGLGLLLALILVARKQSDANADAGLPATIASIEVPADS
ncbi:MFS transporter [soil metagenome]